LFLKSLVGVVSISNGCDGSGDYFLEDVMNRKKILIVDEDPFFRFFISFALEVTERYDVIQAVNSEKAMACFNSEPPTSMVISDIKTSHKYGMSLLPEIRKLDYDIPFLYLVGKDSKQFIRGAMMQGATEFVSKESLTYESVLNLADRYLAKEGNSSFYVEAGKCTLNYK
jgi:DNA-binding NtrC family response regulator